ncbi:MAG: type III-A CRISPR-associated protein Cas10/Csm1 [Desulfobacterota bacterium]|nr:type III-A CRISPR-associated protein Cas10/Csm1 [Thermodesulfobacteriota bacterium]
MIEERFRTELVLGALLHDIGKVRQRAQDPSERGMTHGEIGYRWLSQRFGEGIIASAARSHHGKNAETWLSNFSLLIYEADNRAASERRSQFDKSADEGKSWQSEVQLASVFSRVGDPRTDSPSPLPPPAAYHRLIPLDEWQPPSPQETPNSSADYRRIWEGFSEGLDLLRAHGNHRNIDAVLHLLEKYTAFVPSITLRVKGVDDAATYRKHPDVSLFDHMKVTAALAMCMGDYYSELHASQWSQRVLKEEITGTGSEADQPFLLLGGDLSGVQQFIYTISSKGAMRSLKGRSFFLELVTEYVVDRLLEETSLSRCNVIFTGGGRFYLVVANTPASMAAVEKVRGEVNEWLLADYNGLLQQYVETVPFSKGDVHEISAVWSILATRLEEAKRRKWEHHLERILQPPAEPHPSCLESGCQVCGREDRQLVAERVADSEALVCEPCGDQMRLGIMLHRAVGGGENPVLVRLDGAPPTDREKYVRVGSRFYRPVARMPSHTSEKDQTVGVAAVYHLNDWNLHHFSHPESRPFLAGLHLPGDEDGRDLEGMAAGGLGIDRIAVLRMDVDHLGRIFSKCIPEGERTLSRMASLSRQVSLFFKYHINGLLGGHAGYPEPMRFSWEEQRERLASVVYSGGDDLFLIGHWLDVAEAGFDIQAAFGAFTGNPHISLSAGMTLGGAHDPVYRLAERAGDAESRAKAAGRRSVTLFDRHTLPWSEARSTFQLVKTLSGFGRLSHGRLELPGDSISHGFFYRLLQLVRNHNEAMRSRGKSRIWLMPKLAYTFGRCRPQAAYVVPFSELKNYVFSNDVQWEHVEVALHWFLMMLRRGGDR